MMDQFTKDSYGASKVALPVVAHRESPVAVVSKFDERLHQLRSTGSPSDYTAATISDALDSTTAIHARSKSIIRHALTGAKVRSN